MRAKLFAVLDGCAGSIISKNFSEAACSAVFHRNATELFPAQLPQKNAMRHAPATDCA
jgi:hypothetical protein